MTTIPPRAHGVRAVQDGLAYIVGTTLVHNGDTTNLFQLGAGAQVVGARISPSGQYVAVFIQGMLPDDRCVTCVFTQGQPAFSFDMHLNPVGVDDLPPEIIMNDGTIVFMRPGTTCVDVYTRQGQVVVVRRTELEPGRQQNRVPQTSTVIRAANNRFIAIAATINQTLSHPDSRVHMVGHCPQRGIRQTALVVDPNEEVVQIATSPGGHTVVCQQTAIRVFYRARSVRTIPMPGMQPVGCVPVARGIVTVCLGGRLTFLAHCADRPIELANPGRGYGLTAAGQRVMVAGAQASMFTHHDFIAEYNRHAHRAVFTAIACSRRMEMRGLMSELWMIVRDMLTLPPP